MPTEAGCYQIIIWEMNGQFQTGCTGALSVFGILCAQLWLLPVQIIKSARWMREKGFEPLIVKHLCCLRTARTNRDSSHSTVYAATSTCKHATKYSFNMTSLQAWPSKQSQDNGHDCIYQKPFPLNADEPESCPLNERRGISIYCRCFSFSYLRIHILWLWEGDTFKMVQAAI